MSHAPAKAGQTDQVAADARAPCVVAWSSTQLQACCHISWTSTYGGVQLYSNSHSMAEAYSI